MSTTVLSVGIACIVAAIVGGGMKALGVEIPTISSVRRQSMLAFFGVLLFISAFFLDKLSQTKPPEAQSTTETKPDTSQPRPQEHPPASPTHEEPKKTPHKTSARPSDTKLIAGGAADQTKPPDPSEFNSPSLVGTWEIANGDSGAAQASLLELHADGTYKKTLTANVNNVSGVSNSYGGTHIGTWQSRGTMVHLSGDGNWPPYMQDLSKARKLN